MKKKLYYQSDNFEFIIINNLNQNQIMFIKNILIKFINTIEQFKMEFLQNASDIDMPVMNCLGHALSVSTLLAMAK